MATTNCCRSCGFANQKDELAQPEDDFLGALAAFCTLKLLAKVFVIACIDLGSKLRWISAFESVLVHDVP